MQEAVNKQRLHPLLTAAAVSVTVFSAVGIGAVTGLLPTSLSSTRPASELVSQAAAPTPPVGAQAVKEAREMPPAAPAETPAAEPVKKPVHAKKVSKAKPARAAKPIQVAEAPQAQGASVPPPPPAPAAEAPKPAPGLLGVVESVREVSTPAEKSNGIGPIAGGIAGAVLGNQVGHGDGRTIATVLGAAAGALGGKEVEKRARATKHWEIVVRLDNGRSETLKSDTTPYWHGGERVRLLDGRLQPA